MAMNDELFAELMASVEEAGRITCKEAAPRGCSPSSAICWT